MILITGSQGQLGNELKIVLAKETAIYTDYAECDITNIDSIRSIVQSKKITSIINCAAYTAVDKAETDIEKAFLINQIGAKNLATIAVEFTIPLIHISTDYVFDGTSSSPLQESDNTNPVSIYGKSKLEGENEILKINPKGAIIRTSWLYSSFGSNFVKSMISLGTDRDQLSIVADQVGSPTNAADLALVIHQILPQIENKDIGIYHYANEGICSWYDFTKAIFEIKQIKCMVLPIESKDYPVAAPRPAYSVLNKNKIKTTFNINIPYWKESLDKCIIERF